MFCELLSLLGLKVVPKDYQSIDKERVAALLVMSKSWMNRIETVDDLFHDEISGQKEKLGYYKKPLPAVTGVVRHSIEVDQMNTNNLSEQPIELNSPDFLIGDVVVLTKECRTFKSNDLFEVKTKL